VCFRDALTVFVLGATACGSGPPAQGPRDALAAYASALEQGRVEEAYALLSDDAKRSIPLEAFRRMLKDNPAEVKDIVASLDRPAGPPRVTATVSTASGQNLLLVYEDGEWRIDGSAINLYAQDTPRAALEAFVRAYENRRFDVLMRFVPDSGKSGLNQAKLKRSFEGEQREELDQLTQGLKAALPTSKVEVVGNRATMPYGAGGSIELLREHGVWKIEELNY
jgi:hypothetical protein